jgi:hypothetical protein
MLYATATFWLLLIVLLAEGINRTWCGLVKPKAVNIALLPATAITHLGHIVALLITGAAPTAPAKGGQGGSSIPQSRIPVVGPILVALLPMLGLGIVIYFAILRLGMPVMTRLPADKLATELPGTMSAFWDQLVGFIRLAEGSLNAVLGAESVKWQVVLFVYLFICLTVRMAPLPGNLRGHVGAVVVVGVLAWLAGSVATTLPDLIRSAWPMFALSIGFLILLLMATMVMRAAVTVTKVVLHLA